MRSYFWRLVGDDGPRFSVRRFERTDAASLHRSPAGHPALQATTTSFISRGYIIRTAWLSVRFWSSPAQGSSLHHCAVLLRNIHSQLCPPSWNVHGNSIRCTSPDKLTRMGNSSPAPRFLPLAGRITRLRVCPSPLRRMSKATSHRLHRQTCPARNIRRLCYRVEIHILPLSPGQLACDGLG